MDGQPVGLEEAFALDATPAYRVEFSPGTDPAVIDPAAEIHPDAAAGLGSESPERWRLISSSNVHEALVWAEDHRGKRGYVLYAEWRDLDGLMLLSRLAEEEPR
ncbi:MAG: hypothetical protein ABI255_00540 [Microbacteriaceae bacterium]